MGLAEQALGDDPDREAVLRGGDRGPQAGAAGADDQYVVLAHLVLLTGPVGVSVALHSYLPSPNL
jgi:hypothetical protein